MRKLINYKLLFLSPFFLAACSNEDNIPSILPSNQPDAVELGITAGVTLTKSVINSGTQANASKDDVMKSVAVYARLKGQSYRVKILIRMRKAIITHYILIRQQEPQAGKVERIRKYI